MPGKIMFGDLSGDKADYAKGFLYSSRMTLPASETDNESSLVSTKDMRKMLLDRKKKSKSQKESQLQQPTKSDAENGQGEGDEAAEQATPRSQDSNSRSSATVLEKGGLRKDEKREVWDEYFQAGVQFWVNPRTAEVTEKCPYGDRPNSSCESSGNEDIVGGFPPEMTAQEVCETIESRRSDMKLVFDAERLMRGSSGQKSQMQIDKEELKEFWHELIGLNVKEKETPRSESKDGDVDDDDQSRDSDD